MRVTSADEAVRVIRDGDTVLIGGSHPVPEAVFVALETRFLNEGHPRALTTLHPETPGDGSRSTTGGNRLAHKGLIKRLISGAFVDAPRLGALVESDEIEGYTLPQGVLSQLMREMAAGRPGLYSQVGLHTFVDPRYGGGKQSPSCSEELVELVEIDGQEWLRYRTYRADIALLRGTTADDDGNISMEHESNYGEILSMAQATRNHGGVVIVQVKRLAERGSIPAKQVKVPGILVDLVVVDPSQMQTYDTTYDPAFSGELRVSIADFPPFPTGVRKIIARRAAFELFPGAVCNLGYGIPTGVAPVAAEEGVLDEVVLTNEQGLIGGAPAGGLDAGASRNFSAMIDMPYQFDFYDGGGLDLAFLSFAEAIADGSVNVSRFANHVVGIGGFLNIAQNARRVVFMGTFTAGGLEVEWVDGQMRVVTEGRYPKFVADLQQVTYNGKFGRSRGQEIVFVTERAVFRVEDAGLTLVEIAPGVDIEQDVLDQMQFEPVVSPDLFEMNSLLFGPEPVGLSEGFSRRTGQRVPAALSVLGDNT